MAKTATLYDGVVVHARQAPVAHRFRYRIRLWLVDLADPPAVPAWLRWAASFRAADHVGDPAASLYANAAAGFARDGVDVTGCRLLMLAHPRGLGHGFNPITLLWALGPDGAVRGVAAEVHNTYGGRHRYGLRPDSTGHDVVAKQLYVSPFYGVDGRYALRVSPPDEHISVSVTLHPRQGPAFVATLQADRRAPTGPGRAALVTAGAALRTSALIRRQGIALWARGLRITPRPIGHDQELPDLITVEKEPVA